MLASTHAPAPGFATAALPVHRTIWGGPCGPPVGEPSAPVGPCVRLDDVSEPNVAPDVVTAAVVLHRAHFAGRNKPVYVPGGTPVCLAPHGWHAGEPLHIAVAGELPNEEWQLQLGDVADVVGHAQARCSVLAGAAVFKQGVPAHVALSVQNVVHVATDAFAVKDFRIGDSLALAVRHGEARPRVHARGYVGDSGGARVSPIEPHARGCGARCDLGAPYKWTFGRVLWYEDPATQIVLEPPGSQSAKDAALAWLRSIPMSTHADDRLVGLDGVTDAHKSVLFAAAVRAFAVFVERGGWDDMRDKIASSAIVATYKDAQEAHYKLRAFATCATSEDVCACVLGADEKERGARAAGAGAVLKLVRAAVGGPAWPFVPPFAANFEFGSVRSLPDIDDEEFQIASTAAVDGGGAAFKPAKTLAATHQLLRTWDITAPMQMYRDKRNDVALKALKQILTDYGLESTARECRFVDTAARWNRVCVVIEHCLKWRSGMDQDTNKWGVNDKVLLDFSLAGGGDKNTYAGVDDESLERVVESTLDTALSELETMSGWIYTAIDDPFHVIHRVSDSETLLLMKQGLRGAMLLCGDGENFQSRFNTLAVLLKSIFAGHEDGWAARACVVYEFANLGAFFWQKTDEGHYRIKAENPVLHDDLIWPMLEPDATDDAEWSRIVRNAQVFVAFA